MASTLRNIPSWWVYWYGSYVGSMTCRGLVAFMKIANLSFLWTKIHALEQRFSKHPPTCPCLSTCTCQTSLTALEFSCHVNWQVNWLEQCLSYHPFPHLPLYSNSSKSSMLAFCHSHANTSFLTPVCNWHNQSPLLPHAFSCYSVQTTTSNAKTTLAFPLAWRKVWFCRQSDPRRLLRRQRNLERIFEFLFLPQFLISADFALDKRIVFVAAPLLPNLWR